MNFFHFYFSQFDGVYFQKMYALNVLDEDEEEKSINEAGGEDSSEDKENGAKINLKDEAEIIPNDGDENQSQIVDLFLNIIRK